MHTSHSTFQRLLGRASVARSRLNATAAALLFAAMGSAAHGFPDRPVTLVVPAGPGGVTDTLMRAIATEAGETLGRPVVVENRAGANGTFGAAQVARARDDHTIAALPASVFREPFVNKVAYDVETLNYIIGLTDYIFGVAVREDAPWKDWAEFVADVRQRPGEISMGMAGATALTRVVMGEVSDEAGMDLVFVPYRGESELAPDLLGGHVDVAMMAGTAVQYIDTGRMRYIAMMTAEPQPGFPGVPTLRELGFDHSVNTVLGLAGRPDMQPEHVQVLHDAFKSALQAPRVVEMFESLSLPVTYLSPQEYRNYAMESLELEPERVEYLRKHGLIQ